MLTYRIENPEKGFKISFEGEFLISKAFSGSNFIGFRIGGKGPFNDYRSDAVYGKGLNVGITTNGKLFAGNDTLEIRNFDKYLSTEFEFEVTLEKDTKEIIKPAL